jgi:hypothetical protein
MKRRQFLPIAAAIPAGALVAAVPANAEAAVTTDREVLPGENLQAALDAGPGRVVLAPGVHTLKETLHMRPRRWLCGSFGATTLRATAVMPAIVAVGGGGPIDRWKISDLVIDARDADTGIDINIVGTTGNAAGEPDSQGRIEDVLIGDAVAHGIWYRGKDAQSIITRGVRVRRAGIHAYRIENADSWWSDCEGTTTGSPGAGFHITGSNLSFEHCKAWYCRQYGWRVRGVRNSFTGCASQDTRNHGWRIDYEQNTLTACTADTAAAAAVGDIMNGGDGFYVGPKRRVSLTGCLAYDRRPGTPQPLAQQRYGFNAPKALADAGLLVACTGWDNATALVNKR